MSAVAIASSPSMSTSGNAGPASTIAWRTEASSSSAPLSMRRDRASGSFWPVGVCSTASSDATMESRVSSSLEESSTRLWSFSRFGSWSTSERRPCKSICAALARSRRSIAESTMSLSQSSLRASSIWRSASSVSSVHEAIPCAGRRGPAPARRPTRPHAASRHAGPRRRTSLGRREGGVGSERTAHPPARRCRDHGGAESTPSHVRSERCFHSRWRRRRASGANANR